MNKEQVYDAEIAPLMAQILAICQRDKIAMVAQFALPTKEDPDLVCTSCLTKPEFAATAQMHAAVRILTQRTEPLVALTIIGGSAPQSAEP